jgi:hypothetical protein
MPFKQVKSARNDFAHLAGGITGSTFDELGGNGVGVLVAGFTYEIEVELYSLTLGDEPGGIAKQHSIAILFLDGLSLWLQQFGRVTSASA